MTSCLTNLTKRRFLYIQKMQNINLKSTEMKTRLSAEASVC